MLFFSCIVWKVRELHMRVKHIDYFWKGSLETAEREFLFAEPVWKTFIREKSLYAVMRVFHLLYFCEGKHIPQQEAKTTLFNVSSNINFSSLNHLNANFIIKHNTVQPVFEPSHLL